MSQCCHLSCVFDCLCPQSDVFPRSSAVSHFPEHINRLDQPRNRKFWIVCPVAVGNMAVRCHRAVIIGVVVITAGVWRAVRPSGAQEQQEQREQQAPAAKRHTGQLVIRVQPGDDATLPCEAGDVSILAVEWTRPDLEPPQYVLFYRDGHFDTDEQHPSFTGRVELVHRDLKDGDVSLTLKNVNSRDTGIYECRVKSGGSRRTKRANIKTDPIRVIYLEVTGAEKEHSMGGPSSRGYVGLAAGCGVVAVLLLAAAVFVAVLIYKRRTNQRSEQSSVKGSVDPLI